MGAHESGTPDLPLILLVGAATGPARSLEPALVRGGYAVLTADGGSVARQRLRSLAPDAILADTRLPDGSGAELCRALRGERGSVTAATAIVLVNAGTPGREERLEALRAGASDVLSGDGDPEELLQHLGALVRAKLHADRNRLEGLFDPVTGLYNRHGLVRRAQELASLMFRQHGALACLVLTLEPEAGGEMPPPLRAQLAQALASAGRRSDVLGQVGPNEVAVLAPGTDAAGALGLAERLGAAAQSVVRHGGVPTRVRAGYEAIPNLGYEPVDPVALLLRARTALRNGRPEGRTSWVRRFEDAAAPRAPRR